MPSAPAIIDDIEHIWIEMPDGVRLAARLWLPDGADDDPVPAIFEIIPYRKGDMVRARDERNHPYFAANGYACVRVDMRGSGDSEGLMADMYEPDELSDTRHVIEWIAAQPWCNGRVGMFGTSWGGTASLQASVNAPRPLKAVIAVCATHDRYEDDIHHMGGCLLTDSIEWGATLPAILASPPSAETVGTAWREMWQQRLENLAFPLETWVREEARGAYWRSGSTRFEAERFNCPILAVGGWSDRYSNSVMSLVDAKPDSVWGIVGPWGHHFPDAGHPGPAMNFQQVALDWWDHWLKSSEPVAPDWPKLRLWQREFDPPADALDHRNGHWIEWNPVVEPAGALKLHLADGRLEANREPAQQNEAAAVPHDLNVGRASGDTGYFGRFGGLPLDQTSDDERSLVYESEPLSEDLVIAGAAEITLKVTSDIPSAQLSLRISDVSPEGVACRVTMAIQNLALDGALDERPEPAAGTHQLTVRFHTTAYRFKQGHRIRLALASSYWPLVWPSPGVADLRIPEGGAALRLPVLQSVPAAAVSAPAEPSEPAAKSLHTIIENHELQRIADELADGTLRSSWHQPPVRVLHHATGSTFGFETRAEHTISMSDPLSAQSRFEHVMEFKRPDGTAKIKSWAAVSCDAEHFHLSGEVRAFWNNEQIYVRTWSPTLKRRCS
ncbi:MAG: CocE/NonD family hydrolase [Pseudomonadota bacterium]